MDRMKKLSPVAITSIVIGVVALIVIIFSISTYNGLQKKNQAVDAAWSEVENKMQRRADLIPNVVSAVKGQMSHEDKIFTALANARTKYNSATTNSGKVKADAEMTSNLSTLVSAIQENYPTLASSNSVQDLITELEGSENRISVARGRYIKAVQSYNSSIVTFPKNLFASMMGLHQRSTYKAEANASKVPKVDLGGN